MTALCDAYPLSNARGLALYPERAGLHTSQAFLVLVNGLIGLRYTERAGRLKHAGARGK